MSTSASLALQSAVYAALSGNIQLTGLLAGPSIYDDTPQPVSYPFVTLGETTSRDNGTGTEDGEEHILSLHVWSQAAGRSEAQPIMSVVRSVLHDARIAVAGQSLVNLRHEFSDVRHEADGFTIHGLMRFRAATEPSP
jgi:hypothetical protein